MSDTKNFYAVMLIDDNEIDNLINQKMIEAANITEHIFTHTGARRVRETFCTSQRSWSSSASAPVLSIS